MSFDDTLYLRDDEMDEYGDSSAFGDSLEEDYEEEEEEEEAELPGMAEPEPEAEPVASVPDIPAPARSGGGGGGSKPKAKKAPKKKSARKPNPAFMIPLAPSAALADVIGNKPLPRTEIIKKIWDYIKKNKLQDTKNRRMINADSKLKTLFSGKSQVSMFELAKVVSNHVK